MYVRKFIFLRINNERCLSNVCQIHLADEIANVLLCQRQNAQLITQPYHTPLSNNHVLIVRCFRETKMLSANLCGDVLAVRCIKEHVCIGIGNCVRVYHVATRKLVAKLNALRHDNVHSIVEGTANELFVYGGKSLSICEFKVTGDTVKLDVHSVHQFPDWIIAIERAPGDDDTQIRILFAHNNLCFYDTTTKLAREARCQEKCILYGGSLLVKKDHRETIVFAGTVFQEILIWRVKDDRVDGDDVAVLHRLKGHSGVIFSVIYNSTNRIISSTSDDRTIRIWKVTNKLDEKTDRVNWTNAEINLTTTMYGHAARVWRSVVKSDKIVSIGEDSLMCIWTIDGRLLNKIEAHNGAEIWSIDVSEDCRTIFTGGADGAVNVWPFETTDSQEVESVLRNDEKIPKHVCYTNNGNICVFLDGGEVTLHEPLEKTTLISLSLPRFSNYCVMQISPDRKSIGFGSKDGYLEIYEEYRDGEASKLRKSVEIRATESKIFSFHWLSNETILVCGDRGLLKIIDTHANAEDKNSGGKFVLPVSRERWTTAAILHGDLLICGDRVGSVYVFKLHESKNETSPVQIFSKIHGRLGVQSFAISGEKILSTGRDGTVRFYEPRKERSGELLRSLHAKKMPMDWICRIINIDDDRYVLGFKEVEFMIYSMNLKRLVRRFVCGGGHRSWDCRILNGKMNFVYIRDKKVYELRTSLRNGNIAIRDGFHTKEIYSVEPIVTRTGHNILVSAGEDSALRVSCVVDTKLPIERYRVRTLETYDGHISNVKSLALINLEDSEKYTKNLVFSGGGRAQLKIWEMRIRVDDKTLTSDNVMCTELQSYMLRGTDKDRKRASQSAEAAFFVDPETRFMDISAQIYHCDSKFVVIFIACSDGFLRVLLYDIFLNVLHLSNDVNRCNRCTLKVQSFVHENETILLTMTTDGFVGFWKMTACLEKLVKNARNDCASEERDTNVPFTKIRIHQSGINSFDFRKIDDSRYLLFSGGDDNLLSLVVLEISLTTNESKANRISEWKSSSIHSAQITGAKFIGNNRMLSTGIDQRVIVHSYAYNDGVLSVTRIDDAITFIPDVQGVSLSHPVTRNDETLVCVYGKGLEAIILDRNSAYL